MKLDDKQALSFIKMMQEFCEGTCDNFDKYIKAQPLDIDEPIVLRDSFKRVAIYLKQYSSAQDKTKV